MSKNTSRGLHAPNDHSGVLGCCDKKVNRAKMEKMVSDITQAIATKSATNALRVFDTRRLQE